MNSNNNNNRAKNVGVAPNFGNPGNVLQSMSVNHQPRPLLQTQPRQVPGASHFPGHFQMSDPQVQAMAQFQYVNAHTQTQNQAAQAQFVQFQAQGQSHAQLHSTSPGVSSPSTATPSTGTAEQTNQKLPPRPQGSSQANTGLLFKNMELTPAARRTKHKIHDRQIPDKVAVLLP